MYETVVTTVQQPDLKSLERNHYFYGMLLDVYHFERETNYFNAKRRLLNRLISGSGVVCGLDVEAGPGPNQIVITPGMAIDKWGYEIVVPETTVPITIDADVVVRSTSAYTQQEAKEEPCVQVLICYRECESDPMPILAGDCGSVQPCAPSTIREQYTITFKEGCAPPVSLECRIPEVVSRRRIDYAALARLVSSDCPAPPEDPCIPLANIRLEGEHGHGCKPENIDITIRPIVFTNELLLDLLLGLITETPERRRGK